MVTNDKIALQGLLEKSSDVNLLREMIGLAATRARLASGWRAAPLPGGS